MIVESFPQVLFEKAERAHDAAVDDALAHAQATAPRLTGEYADSIEARGEGSSSVIGSPLPQAGAVERGANVGPGRRGPHMGPVGTLSQIGGVYIASMTNHLR
jgi:hypothetical protein